MNRNNLTEYETIIIAILNVSFYAHLCAEHRG